MQCSNRLLAKKLKEQDESEGKAKQAAWNRIKTEQPKLAEFMTAINKTFGKNKATIIEFDGEIIVNQGEYLPERGKL